MSYELKTTTTGFRYGPALVTRLWSDEKLGVCIDIQGANGRVAVRVSPKGRVIEVAREQPKIEYSEDQ